MEERTPLARMLRRASRNESGAVAPILAVSLTAILALAGMSIDVGRVMWVRSQLQASADAAALAGALYVTSEPETAKSTASSYSGLAAGKNAVRGADSVAMVGSTPELKCFTSIKAPTCVPGSSYNGIVVSQRAVVSTYFLRIVGLRSMTPTATATASARGGKGRALDVMIVLDSTRSMQDPDPGCSISNPTKIRCAQAGSLALIQGLNPAVDRVGFMTFPGVTKDGVKSNTECGKTLTSAQVSSYKNIGVDGATYTLVGLTNGFASAGNLDATSPAVIAAGGGVGGCKGIQAVGGPGTYFADAIEQAQAALSGAGGNSQKVMVVLSDGDAGAPSSSMLSSKYDNQCQRAIANARAAAAAGTWVYSVAYAASTSGGCSTDTKNFSGVGMAKLSPCATMQNIASDSAKFYADGSGKKGCIGTGGNNDDLVSLFNSISADLTMPRLIPNDTV